MRKTSQELGRWHDILQRMQTGADCTAGNSSLDFGYRTTMILSHNAAIFIHTFNHRLGSIRRDLQELRSEKVLTAFPREWMGWQIAIIALLQDS